MILNLTMPEEIKDRPPNFDLIAKAFPSILERPDIIFSYGDKMYNPDGKTLSAWIIAHEAAHSQRQLEIPPDEWWAKYIEDRQFRFEEEVIGHRAEFASYKQHRKDRNEHAAYLHMIAQRLSGELYGRVTDVKTAKSLISQPAALLHPDLDDAPGPRYA